MQIDRIDEWKKGKKENPGYSCSYHARKFVRIGGMYACLNDREKQKQNQNQNQRRARN